MQFRSVSFTYPGADQPALADITLTLRPQERVALVGENGAGKTTLVRLLLGLYRPTKGKVTADGTDLADGAFSPQQVHPRIAAAATRSGAGEFISDLPAGYGTLLGKEFEGAVELSAGQWQRLAIARAYLRDAQIIVLDEPTAALDPRAEVAVYRQFREAAAGRCAVFISHRLGSARLADRIIVLRAGHIVEEGTHDALLAVDGEYARMFRLQASWYGQSAVEERVV